MRLFVDATIVKPHLGGIATYIRELTHAFARRPDVALVVATSAADALALPPSVDLVVVSQRVRGFVARAIWRERALRGLVAAVGADVLLAPTVELPLRRLSVPSIMVVHDVGALQAPELYGRLRWARFKAGLPVACRGADHVVAVSHATLSALTELLPGCAASCSVVPEAGRALPILPRAPIVPPYVLIVGSLMRHKNVGTVVAAMREPPLHNMELVLAGPVGRREREFVDAWAAMLPGRIRHVGFVDVETLASLYSGASVAALPSRHEGFGLGLVDAMSCGVPVVASAIPAHREVGGDAPIYVEAGAGPGVWARAIARVMDEPALSSRLERCGRDRAGQFTWEAAAADIVERARLLIGASGSTARARA